MQTENKITRSSISNSDTWFYASVPISIISFILWDSKFFMNTEQIFPV